MPSQSTSYRLGLDLGSNSIGWCAIKLEQAPGGSEKQARYKPCGVLDAGVRILTPNEEAAATRNQKRPSPPTAAAPAPPGAAATVSCDGKND